MSHHVLTFLTCVWYSKYMRKIALQHIVWKEGRYYVAQCLNVDVSSFGKTKKEALASLQEALELYFEDAPLQRVTRVEGAAIVKQELEYA